MCQQTSDVGRLSPVQRLGFHQRVAAEIEREGKYWISTTVLKGQPAFRINPVNFRTRAEHIQGLFHDLKEICNRVL